MNVAAHNTWFKGVCQGWGLTAHAVEGGEMLKKNAAAVVALEILIPVF
ncbi:hypothetical protein ALO95_200074 [Pseudomonas syringae pv. antirrhini]|nr:hypothetical protein ALQ23_200115 [Pseudomonas syringae pv. antirrhini]RMW26858.1 hypothetical protein ALO95_200074 [Pseudomonas syringae pv. antirrhini]